VNEGNRMVFGSRFKTKKEKAREDEEQRRMWQIEANQERDRIAREKSEQERIARELESARLREELAVKNAEIARHQRKIEEQERRARQARKEQGEKDLRAREEKLAEEREKKRLDDLRNKRNQRLRSTEPENLRALRDNVRRKYQLDIDIWAERGVRRPDRPLVEKKMEEADALLDEIVNTVNTWEERDNIFNPDEWRLAEQVKARLLMDGIRRWADKPPWNEN
jgi:hypothetical protein